MKRLKFIVCIFYSLLLFCSSDQIAGSKGGSETTNGIMASVMHSDGTPAAGCSVRMRRVDYFKDPALPGKNNSDNKNGITDSFGRFKIEHIDSGSYIVEVLDSFVKAKKSGASVLFTVALDSNDTINLGTGLLCPLAGLKGKIDSSEGIGQQLYVQVKGLERITKVDSTGAFAFYDLPQGCLDVRIVGSTATIKKEILNVKTLSEDTIFLNISGNSLYSENIYFNVSASEISSSAPITNFPLLIRLDSTFNFNQASLQGNDISFHKLDGTSLPFEIEVWDPISKRSAVWVRIDTIRSVITEQCIVMKWGGVSGRYQSNSTAVFDTTAGFAGVWHLNEDPSSGTAAIKDRTVNGYNGTPGSSMTRENSVAAIIGTGLVFNGTSDSIDAGTLNLSGSYSLSCWVKPLQSTCVNWRFVLKEASYTLWYDNKWVGLRGEHFSDAFTWHGVYQDTRDSVPHPLELSSWYYVVSTFDGNKIRLYINGVIVDSTNSITANPHPNSEVLLFGGRVNEFFSGVMDEVRIERKARPAAWIKLCYLNQDPKTAFVKFRNN